MHGAVVPPAWLFGLRWLSTGAYRLFNGADGGPSVGLCPWVLRFALASVLSVSHAWSPPLQGTLQHKHVGLVWSLRWSWPSSSGSWCTQDFYAFSPTTRSGASVSPSSVEVRQSCCHSKPDSLGTSPPVTKPPGWEARCRTQNHHSSGKTSVLYLFVGHPPGRYCIWFYGYTLSGLSFAFGCRMSFLAGSSIFPSMVTQQLIVMPVLWQEGVWILSHL